LLGGLFDLKVLPYCKIEQIDEDLLESTNWLKMSDIFSIIGSP